MLFKSKANTRPDVGGVKGLKVTRLEIRENEFEPPGLMCIGSPRSIGTLMGSLIGKTDQKFYEEQERLHRSIEQLCGVPKRLK